MTTDIIVKFKGKTTFQQLKNMMRLTDLSSILNLKKSQNEKLKKIRF